MVRPISESVRPELDYFVAPTKLAARVCTKTETPKAGKINSPEKGSPDKSVKPDSPKRTAFSLSEQLRTNKKSFSFP